VCTQFKVPKLCNAHASSGSTKQQQMQEQQQQQQRAAAACFALACLANCLFIDQAALTPLANLSNNLVTGYLILACSQLSQAQAMQRGPHSRKPSEAL
jgi:hypothetical protein